MKTKISLKRPLFISIVGIVLSSIILLALNWANRDSSIKSNSKLTGYIQDINYPKQISGLPVLLRIPKINVDANVKYVGLTQGGAMDVPKGPDEVAWFEYGPRPGDTGSAVISGHYGWKNDIPAVFDDLHKLIKGDKIYIDSETGTTTTFIVRESKAYGENEKATDVFDSGDGKIHLNLITCQGTWNKTKKSYSKRLVVFADKE